MQKWDNIVQNDIKMQDVLRVVVLADVYELVQGQ